MSKSDSEYKAADITVLEGLEPVRKRPAMYIGSTGSSGLHHLVYESVDNAIDEAMGGFCDFVEVEFTKDGMVRISDNGRGIPVDIHPQTKKSALETVMTVLHAGGKFGGKGYKVSGGLHGVGISVVNALSSWMRAEVCRGGKKYVQEYKRGKPKANVATQGQCTKTGTTVLFQPDKEIFEDVTLNPKLIFDHLRRQAYLTPKVHIRIIDSRTKRDETLPTPYNFYFEGGIQAYLSKISQGYEHEHAQAFLVREEKDNVFVEVAFRYVRDIEGLQLAFANNIITPQGGTHMTGFRTALTRVFNKYAETNNFFSKGSERFGGDDIQEGLIAVVSVKLPDPQYEGQTKAKLGNREIRGIVETLAAERLEEFLKRNPTDASAIIQKLLLAQKARQKAAAVRQTILRKGALSGLRLPGKLTDCFTRNPEEAEVFLVEGDSAGGSCKQARDPRIQAILPLRGKILNVEKARIDKMLTSQEIQAIIVALGTAISEEFNAEKLRYHKIVIMTDADIDGSHIRTLLLTLFFRYFQELIDRGHLYIAQPPLYRVSVGKKATYIYSEEEQASFLASLGSDKKADIQRYKGLGEMNPDQLWETTMDPEKRKLHQITIEDAAEADKIFDTLMGDEVKPRRTFIQARSRQVANLDI
jgi:DNA gyrase subunit B